MSIPPEGVESNDSLPKKALPDDALPPVQAPTAGFILQLFLIPMIIVSVVVMVWLMFSWLAHRGADPEKLVEGMRRGDESAWQRAGTLAELLGDRQQEHLRHDPQLARKLVELLDDQIDAAGMEPQQVRLRLFLCRALGEFYVLDGLPVLVKAATLQREPVELDVRRTAIEAIAVLALHVGSEQVRDNVELMDALEAASKRVEGGTELPASKSGLRVAATFALGVIGGERALERLVLIAGEDPDANVRYNAATGLARHGDQRAVAMLVEMLDPDNPFAIEGEEHPSGKSWKRVLIINTGISAVEKLVETNPSAERDELIAALKKLIESEMPKLNPAKLKQGIKVKARGALKKIERSQVGS